MEAYSVSTKTAFFTIFSIVISVNSVFIASSYAKKVPAMYIFADSPMDVGNNNYLNKSPFKANFPHNGIDFLNKKPTGRFCNDKNAADFLGFNETKGAYCGQAKVPCVPSSTYCSNRSNHVFWDSYHPTEAINKIMEENA